MRWSAFNLSGGGLLISRGLFVSTLLLLAVAAPPFYAQTATPTSPSVATKTPQVTVVDIMPESLSGETDDDTEPNIAVNPANPLQIAASAFTREPMRRADRAPIFVSTDGGNSWSLRSIVPSPQITCDCTLRFGSSSGVLYVSALRNQLQGYKHPELIICQSAGYANTRLMDEVFNNRRDIDQPYIAATTAGKDRVFVGNNDYNFKPGQAALDRSLDSPHSSFTPFSVESRNGRGDSSEVRPALTANGNVVYAAFNRINSASNECSGSWHAGTRTSDVVVVRDDNGGASIPPFSSLVDPTDNKFGRLVVNRTFAWDKCLGGDRLGGDLAIAVHPGDQNKVYLVWSDWVNGHASLHLKYSTNGGQDWSENNKKDIPDAKNPGLAVNTEGIVGFLYQQVEKTSEGYVWKTKLERMSDDFKTSLQPLTFATFPTSAPLYQSCCGEILLGDYLHLMSVRNDFYGIFSSDNTPDRLHFPWDVKFQRRHDFKSKNLLGLDAKPVDPSIDPFFFKVTEQ